MEARGVLEEELDGLCLWEGLEWNRGVWEIEREVNGNGSDFWPFRTPEESLLLEK